MQVENLVAIELAYINTKHPDFAEAYTVHRSISDFATVDTHRSISGSSLTKNMLDRQGEDGKVGKLGARQRNRCWDLQWKCAMIFGSSAVTEPQQLWDFLGGFVHHLILGLHFCVMMNCI